MNASICLFGDSIMKGVVLDDMRGRYILLKKSFANLFCSGTGIVVENYAKFGCTIQAGMKIIEKHAASLAGYRYTALGFGGNDCDFDWSAVSKHPEGPHYARTPLLEFEAFYSEAIDRVTAFGSQPVLFSLPPLDAARYFSWITKGLNAENILRWLGDVEHIYRWHEIYNLVVMKLAAVKNVPLIDIRRVFLEYGNYKELYCEDGIHPNEAGHSLILDTILQVWGSGTGDKREIFLLTKPMQER